MTDTTALDSFLDKWRTRWPEWRVVEVFVPNTQRELALAWFALLQEFIDAMNIAGDPLPADAKLAWWGEELRDWSRQRSRHPLGRVLEPKRAPWFELAETLPVLISMRESQSEPAVPFNSVRPLALAIAQVESALFQHESTDALVQAISVQLLAARLHEAGNAAAPVSLTSQSSTPASDWAAQLLQHWPARTEGAIPRCLSSALARSRLQRFTAVEAGIAPLSPARALWLGWRAASQR